MLVFVSNTSGGSGGSGPSYQVPRSLRFRASATANLTRTPAATSSGAFTVSLWVKRGALGVSQCIIGSSPTGVVAYWNLTFAAVDQVTFTGTPDGSTIRFALQTSAVFRDPSAWYHIVASYDLTTAKLYVNGVQVTSFATSTQNGGSLNNTVSGQATYVGQYRPALPLPLDGYLADVYFIDGQALTPSSFGQVDATWGTWTAINYTGTYGTNGFHLKFDDTTSTSTLCADSSGNGNNWTPTNISLTAGATYDSMYDVPLGSGGSVGNGLGNYPVVYGLQATNPVTLTNGNLSGSGNFGVMSSSFFAPSGKWYFEVTPTALAGLPAYINFTAGGANGYLTDGTKYQSGSISAYGASYTVGDNIGCAVDLALGTATFYKNGISQGSFSFTPTSGTPFYSSANGAGINAWTWNFGQQPFAYIPPTGYLALHTGNLPTPTIQKPNQYFDAVTYTGNGSTQSIVNAGGFQPDLVWVKSRSAATSNMLTDSVRGATKALITDSTGADRSDTSGVTSFNSNGFSIGSDTNYNTNASTYEAWQWKKGAVPGFDIVSYTGTGVNRTVPHALGVPPGMVLVKQRSAVSNWEMWHSVFAGSQTISLNTTGTVILDVTMWNSTIPTSTVFSVGTNANVNTNGATYIAHVFAEVPGFSRFLFYQGNGVVDGPFCYTGFRPRFVMIKRYDVAGDWIIVDAQRNPTNLIQSVLNPNLASTETTVGFIDFVANGIKIRATTNNVSAGSYQICAFAENPFKYALAR